MISVEIRGAQRRDPANPGPRFLLEIDCMERGTAIPGCDKPLKRGLNQVTVCESDMPRVEAKVENRWDLVEQAEVMSANLLRAYIVEQSGEPLPDGDDRSKWSQRQLDAVQTYTGSWQGEFHKLTQAMEGKPRGRRPIRSIKFVKNLGPALDPDSARAVDIVTAMGHATTGDTAGLMARLAALEAQNAEIRAELELARGKKRAA